MIPIDKNIPLPMKRDTKERYASLPLASLAVGDSFKWTVKSVAGIKKRARILYAFELLVKKEGDGFRIWRIK